MGSDDEPPIYSSPTDIEKFEFPGTDMPRDTRFNVIIVIGKMMALKFDGDEKRIAPGLIPHEDRHDKLPEKCNKHSYFRANTPRAEYQSL